MRKNRENKEKKRNKVNKANKDIIVVLFIFAVMILLAVGMTMCGRDNIEVGKMQSNTKYESGEKDNRDEIVIVTTVVVAVIIVICFAVKKVRDVEKHNKAVQEYNELMEKQRHLEEARERVRQARLQEMIDAGIRQLTEKDEKRKYTPYYNKYEDSFEKRKYNRLYDSWDDEDIEQMTDNNYDGSIKHILNNIRPYWWIVVTMVLATIAGGVVIALFVL